MVKQKVIVTYFLKLMEIQTLILNLKVIVILILNLKDFEKLMMIEIWILKLMEI